MPQSFVFLGLLGLAACGGTGTLPRHSQTMEGPAERRVYQFQEGAIGGSASFDGFPDARPRSSRDARLESPRSE
jgi:hypothetical protein